LALEVLLNQVDEQPAMICHPTGAFASSRFQSESGSRAVDEAALVLWLRWNDAFEKVNREMYLHRSDPEVLDVLMSQLDDLRKEAVRQTEAALSVGCEA
jgi:hypothetical protein